jgi:hypothetical protein
MPGVANPFGGNIAEMQRRGGVPAGAFAETISRWASFPAGATVISGTLRLGGILAIPGGTALTSISFVSGGTAAVTPTNQWFCLVRQSDLAVLAKTVDDTTNPWNANAVKTLALTSPLISPIDVVVYVGVVVVATTPPNFKTLTLDATVAAIPPVLAANSTAGLTTPASLGATAGPAGAVNSYHYAYVG